MTGIQLREELFMLSPEYDPRLRSPWGPVRASVGWWAKPIADAVINENIIDAESGRLEAHFGKYVADDMIGRALALMDESLSDEGQDSALIGQAQASMMRLHLLAPVWAHFIACGQQVFEFTPQLVEILKHQDISRAKFAAVKNTFRSFFVRFGTQLSLGLPWEDKAEFVDGAFFSFQDTNSAHPALVICLSMIFADGRGMLSQGPVLKIDGKHFDLPVEQAFDEAIRDAERLADKLDSTVASNPLGPLANLGPGLMSQTREDADIFRRALPLLANSLSYLSSTPVPDAAPSHDAPPALADQVLNASTPSAREEAVAQLIDRGYVMARPCAYKDAAAD
jgi:hypothetical protein